MSRRALRGHLAQHATARAASAIAAICAPVAFFFHGGGAALVLAAASWVFWHSAPGPTDRLDQYTERGN